jgi:hypothetical protein
VAAFCFAPLRLLEIARVLVRPDHTWSFAEFADECRGLAGIADARTSGVPAMSDAIGGGVDAGEALA